MSDDFTRDPRFVIANLILDQSSVAYLNADVEQERKVAIFDLLEENYFRPIGSDSGPYKLTLSVRDNRLVFDITAVGALKDGGQVTHILSLSPFRRIVKDYFMVCESYFDAIKHAPPSQIEAIDMGRRGLHNEGSQTLIDRLDGKIEVDFDTARRLFTLICVLHIKR